MYESKNKQRSMKRALLFTTHLTTIASGSAVKVNTFNNICFSVKVIHSHI
ncbi:hypothetical protein Lalb_Chr19g0128311 [Lupinus albus]|uniref:Uncharacterized protein n=1 Tax=Lupinus albus TaxID=3870 RepID=A0A6A4NSC1_LUPAL|nr:hypothetical protein Lalb_Chr19g0128311 [Lupinus albus]